MLRYHQTCNSLSLSFHALSLPHPERGWKTTHVFHVYGELQLWESSQKRYGSTSRLKHLFKVVINKAMKDTASISSKSYHKAVKSLCHPRVTAPVIISLPLWLSSFPFHSKVHIFSLLYFNTAPSVLQYAFDSDCHYIIWTVPETPFTLKENWIL